MKYLYLITLLIAIVSCQVNQKQSEKTKQTNSEKWFEEGAWKQGWNVSADESVDKIEFKKVYEKNPERWEKAFSFLATTDLKNIEPGKYKLENINWKEIRCLPTSINMKQGMKKIPGLRRIVNMPTFNI